MIPENPVYARLHRAPAPKSSGPNRVDTLARVTLTHDVRLRRMNGQCHADPYLLDRHAGTQNPSSRVKKSCRSDHPAPSWPFGLAGFAKSVDSIARCVIFSSWMLFSPISDACEEFFSAVVGRRRKQKI